jgi:nitroreductase
MVDMLQIIKSRQSVRAFLKKPVEQSLIHAILEAARFAPSGANTQPWQVVVVTQTYIQQIGDAIIAARNANVKENPDYHYYPNEWYEPYKSRRKACGLALYNSLNITMQDPEQRKLQWYRNYTFFGAPVGLLFFLDLKLEKGSWVDMGMFIQNVMLAAKSVGLDTCPQAALAEYPDIVRKIVEVPKEKALLCGMALGYADYQHPVNQYRTTRGSVETFTQFRGF